MRLMTQLLAVAVLLIPLSAAVNAQDTTIQPPKTSVLKPTQDQKVSDREASPSDNVESAPSVADVALSNSTPHTVAGICCDCYQQVVCCYKPAPSYVTEELCIYDCDGCPHRICVRMPRCCCNEKPCITWRNGILRRQVACISWTCCNYSVEVVVNRFGKAWVRY